MTVLSKNQKRLRAVEKKIRHSKPKNGSWDMEKIERLEKQREIIMNLIQVENKKKEEKEAFKNMSGDQAIEFFKEEPREKQVDHTIPNTPHTRRIKKKVIQNLNEHMMSEMMNYQVRARMNIIKQLEESRENGEEKKEVENEFEIVKNQIQQIFTS
uniref:Uncharacterized protein n=1 Tax=viral metagenome TaxID=1070528 RepID=A0A6C0FL35_9ZZZZ|tara:strand:- start:167 stop:634 length:468 start_codon:yes stop_codon:yes gene_type:complete